MESDYQLKAQKKTTLHKSISLLQLQLPSQTGQRSGDEPGASTGLHGFHVLFCTPLLCWWFLFVLHLTGRLIHEPSSVFGLRLDSSWFLLCMLASSQWKNSPKHQGTDCGTDVWVLLGISLPPWNPLNMIPKSHLEVSCLPEGHGDLVSVF